MQITKAVFPVAGLGSRFLPATKANPKEMLPIVDKPLIQYAVEEAVRAGIKHMIFITSSSKRAIEDHFDNNFELEMLLAQQSKNHLLNVVKNISPVGIQFTYVRQHLPLGLGHAILAVEHVIGNEPFAVLLADDLIDETKQSCLGSMVEYFNQSQNSLVAVQQVPLEEVHQYGIVRVSNLNSACSRILSIVEKPDQKSAPSNLAAIGRYIFTPGIFDCLKETSIDDRGEVQLTCGIDKLLVRECVNAFKFSGKRYDCGSKFGYVQAMIEFAEMHAEIGEDISNYLKARNNSKIEV